MNQTLELIDLIDPMDQRLRPPSKAYKNAWELSVQCSDPEGHVWAVKTGTKHGWRQIIKRYCRFCGLTKNQCYTAVAEGKSTAGIRGPLSNHEFIALYLIKHGPTHPDVLKKALRIFRSIENGSRQEYGTHYFRPEASSSSGGTDSRGRNWCGLVGSQRESYWITEILPKVKGVRRTQYGKFRLTALGLYTASRALAKAAVITQVRTGAERLNFDKEWEK